MIRLKLKKFVKAVLFLVLALIFLALTVAGFYAGKNNYHANASVSEDLTSTDLVTVSETKNCIVFTPKKNKKKVGLVFYPETLVEARAYIPLCKQLAVEGVQVLLVEMPLENSYLMKNAAQDAIDQVPKIEKWYLAGHGQGGQVVAQFAAAHPKELKGVFLLGTYSKADLRKTKLKVVSIYGSEDRLLDMEQYQKSQKRLPKKTEEYVVSGGNHAYFGYYGTQKGDGEATITAEDQIVQTATVLLSEMGAY